MAAAVSIVSFSAGPPTAVDGLRVKDAPRRVRCNVASNPAVRDAGGEAAAGRVSADCVVVGGGISGLCTAQALSTKHAEAALDVLVTEAKDRVGGNITTVERDGYLWEEGPNSFQPSDPVLSMAVDSGLKEELVFGDPNAPRFVLWDGKLRPVPSKLTDMPVFDLMSIGGKLRAGFGAIGIRPSPPGHEESVEEFVRRNLGDEVFERLIEPFCSGVYAGDPAKLSMKAAFGKVWKLEQNGGSIIGGTIKAIQERNKIPKQPRDPNLPKPKGQTVASFRKGLATLPNAIYSRLGNKVKLSWKLTSIRKLDNQGYILMYETPEGLKSVETKSVILTIPSYVASDLLRPLSNDAAEALSKFYYPPVAAVSVSYPKEAIRKECLIDGELRGFGQLHPRSQGVETLGTIYSSSLFPNRAPPGRVLLLNYIGGATNTGIVSKAESELVEAVDRDLRKILISPNAPDPVAVGVRVWPKAIPQFLVGHLDSLEAAKTALSQEGFDGLFLGGNYVAGVALGRCIEGAYESASQVAGFLSKYAYN
ncbi:protoporphyrinogen oxidase, chloroplastic-like isoform X2 [Zingiber officinale]|uniref:protoporphyrinogen oxidase, chloroplastic-like isoform X2 n=1 Tax=Zingiber officinale TaxID=94328 RepID=UPI001C4BDCF2|nr:protoporphyrinogen oxidase, chloroplastic-like isoform X2 [Zingiber officinale]